MAKEKKFFGTFTARHGGKADFENPQPAIWTEGPIEQQRGHQEFPYVYPGQKEMTVSARHVRDGATLFVDGRRVSGTIDADRTQLKITLKKLPSVGMHFLQIMNRGGMLSNDFVFNVTADQKAATKAQQQLDKKRADQKAQLADAVSAGNLKEVKRLVKEGVDVSARHPENGTTPLSTAAMFANMQIAEFLIKKGARVSGSNRDGNTSLHVAAFFCHFDMVQLLLENGASLEKKNRRDETAVDVVAADWNSSLSDYYSRIKNSVGLELDLERLKRDRPRIEELLRKHQPEAQPDRGKH